MRIKVRIYKGPAGETLTLPTLAHAFGTIFLYVGGILFCLSTFYFFQDKMKVNSVFLILEGILLGMSLLGLFMRKWAKRKAQTSYLEALAQRGQTEQKKT